MQIQPFEYISANYRLFIQEDNGHKELLKVLREDSADYEKALFNLQNEYNLLKDSTVKGIRKAVKIGLFQNQPALHLEYIEGKSIRDFFEIWSLIEKLETAIRLSQILTNLHLLNIIHKDINPNNIIVSSDHEVHIIDLGISSRFSQKQSHLGNPKHLEGTLRYISPEQTGRVNKIVDYRSDLYSLGIILYELFTGKVPFSFTDPMELVHAHIATSVPKLENIDENVSFISQIILKLLQKNAEDRYQSGAGLQHDLEKCLEDYKKMGK